MSPKHPITTEYLTTISLPLMLDIGNLITSKPSQDVLTPALMILADQFALEDAAITIFDSISKEIYIDTSYGLSSIQQDRGRYQLGEGIIGEVVKTNKKILVPKINEEPKFLSKTKKRTKTVLSFICVPIQHNNNVTGTLSLTLPYQEENNLELLADLTSIIVLLLLQPIILRRQLTLTQKKLEEQYNQQHIINSIHATANTRSIQKIKKQIQEYRHIDSPIFIYGEHGTGKTFVANYLHKISDVRENTLIQCNCSLLTPKNCAHILLGEYANSTTPHTPSTSESPHSTPLILLAQNNSLLIEDIDLMPRSVQEALFNIIQKKELLVDHNFIKLSTRYIFTSIYSPDQLLEDGKLYPPLYHMIEPHIFAIAPLRERKEEIIMLTDHFLETINQHYQQGSPVGQLTEPLKRLSTPAIDLLSQYHWPGNINELKKVIETAAYKSERGVIHAYMLPPSLQSAKSTNTQNTLSLFKAIERLEKDYIIDALKTTDGNIAKSASLLNISERIMGLRIKKYQINPKLYR